MIGRINLICRSLEFFASTNNRDDTSFSTPAALGVQRHSEPQAKNPEKNIFKVWILRFAFAPLRMTIHTLILAAILSFNVVSESWAATSGCDCGSTANGGSASDCCWKIEDGVLTIYPNPNRSSSGNVTMKDFGETYTSANKTNGYTYEYASTAPWARQNVTSVVVENGISNIGNYAFDGDTKITDIDLSNVTSIGFGAFFLTTSLESVNMPNVTSIGGDAFYYATSLAYVEFDPSNISIGPSAFSYTKVNGCGTGDNYSKCNYCTNGNTNSNISGDATIYQPSTTGNTGSCVATCADGYTANNGLCKQNPTQSTPATPVDDDLIDDIDDLESCPEGKIAKGDECIPASQGCGENYKLDNGICYRIRYTPAEAAQVVGETNTIFLYYK